MSTSLSKTLQECRFNLLEALNTPHSVALSICYRYEQYDELYNLLKRTVPLYSDGSSPYENINNMRAFFQANALFSKSDDLPAIDGLEEAAIHSFFECEEANSETNKRFLLGQVSSPLIYRTNQILIDLLGDFSELDYAQNLRFGPGSSSTCRGLSATLAHKLESDILCTPRSQEILDRTFRHFYQYYYRLKPIVATATSNSFLTIPKTFKERRGICIGQHGNIIGQLALGSLYRRKFKRFVNLDRAADFHRKLVKEKWSEIATIDLRRASQMISRRAVQAVWPEQWLSVMDDLREEYTNLYGILNYNQHYSAMGNGFTFEMESVLFYSLCKAAMQNKGLKWNYLSVFGDDIIVDKECAEVVIEALVEFGFEINQDKTFIDGPFKESCGMDTLRGHEVRPIFLRNYSDGKILELKYKLANSVLRMASNSCSHLCLDGSFYRTWISVIRSIPEHRRFFSTSEIPIDRFDGYLNAPSRTPESDDVLYVRAGRDFPSGTYNTTKIGRKYDEEARYWPSVGDIQLGLALLGGSPDGEIPRKSSAFKIVKKKLRYMSKLSTTVWTT